jgi:hypothetical protein
MSLVCTAQVDGIPIECRNGNNFVLMRGLYFFAPGFSFADAATAGDDANWKQGVVDGNIFPVHGIREIEDTSTEDSIYESAGGDKKELYEGKRGFKASFDMTLDAHKTFRKYAGLNYPIAWYDRNNNIYMHSPDGTQLTGMDVDFSNVQKQMLPTADTPAFSIIEFQLSEASQWDDFGAVVQPTKGTTADKWLPSDIDSVTKVIVDQVGSVSGNSAVFTVKYKSLSETDNQGDYVAEAAVTGMDVTTFTNFTFTDGSAVVAPDTMTESATTPGEYTANFTTFTTGTVQILPTVESGSVEENLYNSDSTALT